MNKLFLIGAIVGIGFGIAHLMKKSGNMPNKQDGEPQAQV